MKRLFLKRKIRVFVVTEEIVRRVEAIQSSKNKSSLTQYIKELRVSTKTFHAKLRLWKEQEEKRVVTLVQDFYLGRFYLRAGLELNKEKFVPKWMRDTLSKMTEEKISNESKPRKKALLRRPSSRKVLPSRSITSRERSDT
jgi:hypothetical protein